MPDVLVPAQLIALPQQFSVALFMQDVHAPRQVFASLIRLVVLVLPLLSVPLLQFSVFLSQQGVEVQF